MKKIRNIMAMVLCLALVLSLVVIPSAAPAADENPVAPSVTLSSGEIRISGNKTPVLYSNIANKDGTFKNGHPIKLAFDVYADPNAYTYLDSLIFNLSFDSSVLEYSNVNVTTKNANNRKISCDVDDNSSGAAGSLRVQIYNDASIGIDETTGFIATVQLEMTVINASGLNTKTATAPMSMPMEIFKSNVTVYDKDGNYSEDKSLVNLVKFTPITVDVTAYTVSYDFNGGTGITAIAPGRSIQGAAYNVASGKGLSKDVDGVHYIFAGWTYNGNTYCSGKDYDKNTVIDPMPAADITLVAAYSPDKDKDDIPDVFEKKVTFKMRDNLDPIDEKGINYTTAKTDNGYFYDAVKDADGDVREVSINVLEGAALGNSIVTISLPTSGTDTWKEIGLATNDSDPEGTLIKNISGHTISTDTVIYACTKLDNDGDDDDDRLSYTLIVNDAAGDEQYNKKVPSGTTYEVVDPAGNPIVTETVTGDVTKTLPAVGSEKIPARDADGNPFDKWVVTETKSPEGKITKVTAEPSYSPSVPTQVGPVVEIDPDDPNPDPKPTPGDIDIDLPVDAYISYRDEQKVEISRSVVVKLPENMDKLTFTAPSTPSARVPAKNASGNPFLYWVLDKTIRYDENNQPYVTVDATYGISADLSFTKPGETTPVWKETVPYGTPYTVKDENGNPIPAKSGTVGKDTNVELPTVPEKNPAGETFTGKWIPSVTYNNGDPTSYITGVTLAPEYKKEDVDIIVDPDISTVDGDGNGFHVLGGKWAKDTSYKMKFYLSIDGAIASDASIAKLKVAATGAYGFESFSFDEFATVTSLEKTGTKKIGDKMYTEMTLTYTENRSGIMKVTVTYEGDKDYSSSYVVVTVADVNKTGTVNSGDVTLLKKIINEYTAMPKANSEGSYVFELGDINETGTVNSGDVTLLKKMVNEYITSN